MAQLTMVSALELANETLKWTAKAIDALVVSSDRDYSIGGTQLNFSLDCQLAILKLCETNLDGHLRGPAFALLRPQLESFLVGAWLRLVATDDQIALFRDGKLTLDNLERLARDLESEQLCQDPFQAGVLTGIAKHKRILNSLAHGGIEHGKRQFDGREIAPRYSDNDTAEILKVSSLLALYATAVILSIAGAALRQQCRETLDRANAIGQLA
jgi:hypothetical protein